MTDEFVKVIFPLQVDDDGFPPISAERLNARPDGDGFILDNTPFFVEGIALGDLVDVTFNVADHQVATFVQVKKSSSWKAISIILLDDSLKGELLRDLRDVGCYCEYGEFASGSLRMLAVGVPESADYGAIATRLSELEDIGRMSFAELAVTPGPDPTL